MVNIVVAGLFILIGQIVWMVGGLSFASGSVSLLLTLIGLFSLIFLLGNKKEKGNEKDGT